MPDEVTPEQAVEALWRARFDRPLGPFGVAVSGGGDSLALLLAAEAFARQANLSFRAATVDHGLRPEAAAEAQQVAEICIARGIPHDTLTLNLCDGPGLQARARTARYDVLRAWGQGHTLAPILMGHTQDDVTESLVMRLRRGVGLDGLAEMPEWWTDGQGQAWARPFLGQRRTTLRAYLATQNVVPIEDPSNEDSRFERIEIRKALATLGWADGALARSARHLASTAQAFDTRLDALFYEVFETSGSDFIFCRRKAAQMFRNEADSLRRLLVAAIGAIGTAPPPREAEQARLLAYVRSPNSPGITLGGCRILRDETTLRLCRELSACAPSVPFGQRWDGRWEVLGPDASNLTVGALGDDIDLTPWRDGPLPRASAMTQPAVRRGSTLVAAPTVGLSGGYRVIDRADPRAAFRHRRPFFN